MVWKLKKATAVTLIEVIIMLFSNVLIKVNSYHEKILEM